MEYSKANFGGRPSGTQMRPISPVPATRGVPNIQKAVVIPGVNCDTQGFSNRGNVRERMVEDLRAHHPNLTQEEVSTLADTATDSHFDIITDEKKNKKSFSFLDTPLPENTKYSDIKMRILSYNKRVAKECNVEIYLGKEFIKRTNFHELELENTVKGTVSDSGQLLFAIGLGGKLLLGERTITNNKRMMKKRLSDDIKNIFGLDDKRVFIEKNGEYILQLDIVVDHPIAEIYKSLQQELITKSVFDIKL